MNDLAFSHGKLISIKSPVAPNDDKDADDLHDYGFVRGMCLSFGDTDINGIEIYGPNEREDGYRFICVLTLNSAIEYVWCESLIDLHGYLIWAAPLIQMFEAAGEETI
jgi:hypothetical protein